MAWRRVMITNSSIFRMHAMGKPAGRWGTAATSAFDHRLSTKAVPSNVAPFWKLNVTFHLPPFEYSELTAAACCADKLEIGKSHHSNLALHAGWDYAKLRSRKLRKRQVLAFQAVDAANIDLTLASAVLIQRPRAVLTVGCTEAS